MDFERWVIALADCLRLIADHDVVDFDRWMIALADFLRMIAMCFWLIAYPSFDRGGLEFLRQNRDNQLSIQRANQGRSCCRVDTTINCDTFTLLTVKKIA